MSLLGASDITKAYGTRTLLAGVSLTITEGERIGVVGRNGAGKSTLARVLAGVEPTDTGTISVRRGARIMYLAQEPDIDFKKTAREVAEEGLGAWAAAVRRHDLATEALTLGLGDMGKLLEEQLHSSQDVERLGGWDRSHLVEGVLGHLGIEDIHQVTGTMSGGQLRRVAIARVLIFAPDLMILDEPTNHLDADSIDWLERYLSEEFRGAVLLVTHDRWLLDAVVDRTLEVENGSVFSYEGGYESFLFRKAERRDIEDRTERNRKNFLRTELEWLSRQPKARSTKQKARIGRAESARDQVITREVGQVELSATATEMGKSVLDIKKLDLSMAGKALVKGFDLSLTTGDRLGVLGPNGSGKSTLLRAITGEVTPLGGEITLGRRVRIGYLDQKRAGLDESMSVFETVADAVPIDGKESIDPRSYLERFLFDSSAQRKKVAALSGGERARLCLARLLASSANLLLLDEPSNDLDIDTLSALEDFLSSWDGCVMVVTHDRYLLDRVTNGILSFEGEGKVVRYAGAYQAYATLKEREAEAKKQQKSAARASAAPEATKRPEKKSGISKNEQRVLDEIPQKIDEAEKLVVALESSLSDPALYATSATDDSKAKVIRDQLDKARAEVERLMLKWEELEAKRA